jgi:hypothetical protein
MCLYLMLTALCFWLWLWLWLWLYLCLCLCLCLCVCLCLNSCVFMKRLRPCHTRRNWKELKGTEGPFPFPFPCNNVWRVILLSKDFSTYWDNVQPQVRSTWVTVHGHSGSGGVYPPHQRKQSPSLKRSLSPYMRYAYSCSFVHIHIRAKSGFETNTPLSIRWLSIFYSKNLVMSKSGQGTSPSGWRKGLDRTWRNSPE